MMCVESRASPGPRRRRHSGRLGTARRRASSPRQTPGIAGHRHSRAVATRSPSPTIVSSTLGAQIATAEGIRVLSAAPSSDVITR